MDSVITLVGSTLIPVPLLLEHPVATATVALILIPTHGQTLMADGLQFKEQMLVKRFGVTLHLTEMGVLTLMAIVNLT